MKENGNGTRLYFFCLIKDYTVIPGSFLSFSTSDYSRAHVTRGAGRKKGITL
jgi:hypothetical protein